MLALRVTVFTVESLLNQECWSFLVHRYFEVLVLPVAVRAFNFLEELVNHQARDRCEAVRSLSYLVSVILIFVWVVDIDARVILLNDLSHCIYPLSINK